MKTNVVNLIGNLGKDVETKHLENGNQVSSFSMATSEKYKDKSGETVEDTQWHNIVLWGKQSEIAEKYLKKGSKIALSGKLTTRKWEDKEGNTRYNTEVVGREFLMLGDGGSSAPSTTSSKKTQESSDDDSLPF